MKTLIFLRIYCSSNFFSIGKYRQGTRETKTDRQSLMEEEDESKRCGKVRIVIKCFIAFIYGDYLTVLLVLYSILILGSGVRLMLWLFWEHSANQAHWT